MADVQPFRGVRYSPDAGDLSALTSPPYDVISPAERTALEARDPHNVVRLVLGRDEPGDSTTANKYTRAHDALGTWLASGVFIREDAPALYVYEQRYRIGKREHVQRGVLAAVGLGDDSVLPHERTMAAPVADRLELMRATAANLEPIIVVHESSDGASREAIAAAAAGPAIAAFPTPDGVVHRLTLVSDATAIRAVADEARGARFLIADGHHRHRTAVAYREERRAVEGDGPWDRMMMMIVDPAWYGPSVLPIHRLLSGISTDRALADLRSAFDVEPAATRNLAELERELAERRAWGRCFVLVDREHAWWITLADKAAADEAMPPAHSAAWRDLDVAVLQALVFERLLGTAPSYAHSGAEVDAALAGGEADLAFLLAPTPFEAVRRVAGNGEAMPPKSTFFYPKPRSGVVIRLLDE